MISYLGSKYDWTVYALGTLVLVKKSGLKNCWLVKKPLTKKVLFTNHLNSSENKQG